MYWLVPQKHHCWHLTEEGSEMVGPTGLTTQHNTTQHNTCKTDLSCRNMFLGRKLSQCTANSSSKHTSDNEEEEQQLA
jgi:hypothetical protein